jgi:hypothetical protein
MARIVSFFLVTCAFLIITTRTFAGSELVQDTIIGIFSHETNEDGFYYKPEGIKIAEGSFTKEGAREAIVSFWDYTQSHADAPGELWLLTYNGSWAPKLRVDEADGFDFRLLDLNRDGVDEIFYSASTMHTGVTRQKYCFVTLKGDKVQKLYNEDSLEFDDFSSYKDAHSGEPHRHEIDFRDTDHDGDLEMIDTTINGAYVSGNLIEKVTKKTIYCPITNADGDIISLEPK